MSDFSGFLSAPYTVLAGILVLGLLAQWLAWRFKMPSILLLLLFGLVAGQVGFIEPDRLLGGLLRPVVSFSVAIILFEGSLSLRLKDLSTAGTSIRNLVSVGILTTLVLTALACYTILGIDFSLSLLIAAILTVTGPTVIMPMLRYIRPVGASGKILKWEGIVNDPIGSILAVMVFESIHVAGFRTTFVMVIMNLLRTLFISALLGFTVTKLLVFAIRRDWIPLYLQSPITLMLVLAVFVVSNFIQQDSGLLTVTLMGIIFANEKRMSLEHIIEFKENIGLILLSSLFILLAARLRLDDLLALGWEGLLFLLVLILIIRPATVFLSTRKTGLKLQERTFLAFMAPRGIVAAAISSVFALRLEEAGYVNGDIVAQVVFLSIIGTVVVYAAIAMPLARVLNLASKGKGVLILGAHSWARQLAEVLKKLDVPVMLVDNNPYKVHAARLNGLNTYLGNILSDRTLEDLDLTEFGYFMALLPNTETNSLAALRFQRIFGPDKIYQLYPEAKKPTQLSSQDLSEQLRGRVLIGPEYTYNTITDLVVSGYIIKSTSVSAEFDFEALKETYENTIIPVCVVTETGVLQFNTNKNTPTPKPGQHLIFLAPADLPKDKNLSGQAPS